ncbi:MAG TPA: hypothetical protein PLI35_04885, partial [Acetomicrobium sp.]|nr:hypothetical protein [Acetomicrobium sp.]
MKRKLPANLRLYLDDLDVTRRFKYQFNKIATQLRLVLRKEAVEAVKAAEFVKLAELFKEDANLISKFFPGYSEFFGVIKEYDDRSASNLTKSAQSPLIPYEIPQRLKHRDYDMHYRKPSDTDNLPKARGTVMVNVPMPETVSPNIQRYYEQVSSQPDNKRHATPEVLAHSVPQRSVLGNNSRARDSLDLLSSPSRPSQSSTRPQSTQPSQSSIAQDEGANFRFLAKNYEKFQDIAEALHMKYEAGRISPEQYQAELDRAYNKLFGSGSSSPGSTQVQPPQQPPAQPPQQQSPQPPQAPASEPPQ